MGATGGFPPGVRVFSAGEEGAAVGGGRVGRVGPGVTVGSGVGLLIGVVVFRGGGVAVLAGERVAVNPGEEVGWTRLAWLATLPEMKGVDSPQAARNWQVRRTTRKKKGLRGFILGPPGYY